MATTIKIKHKDTDTGPESLRKGELAYAIGTSPTNSNGGDKLVIGAGTENGSGQTSVLHVIGGKYFTDKLDHVPGVLTPDSAVLVSSESELDEFKVGNFYFDDNVLTVQNVSTGGPGITGATNIDLNITPLRNGLIRYVPTTNGLAPTETYSDLLRIADDDNAIPNKKYVDEEVQGIVTGSTTLRLDGFNDESDLLIPDPTGGQGAVSLGTEKLNIVAGVGLTVSIVDPEFPNLLTAADVTMTFDADIATADVNAAAATLGVASFSSANFIVTDGWVESNSFTLGTTEINLGDTELDIVGLDSVNAGDLTLSGNTIANTTSATDGDIILEPRGQGVVTIGNLDIDPIDNIISATDTDGGINISPNGNGVVSVANNLGDETRITNVDDPINETDATNKRYVDSVAQGLTIRPAARAGTTANLVADYDNGPNNDGVGATLTATTAVYIGLIDGVGDLVPTPGGPVQQTDRLWAAGDLILVKDQTSLLQNGLYEVINPGEDGVSPWVLQRHPYVDDRREIPSSYVFIQEGNTQAGTGWSALVANFNSFQVGFDDVYWFQFSGAGSVTAGNGIAIAGTVVSVRPDEDTGLGFNLDGELAITTVPVLHGGTGRNAVPKNALVFGNDGLSSGDGIGAMGATESPGSTTNGTGDWDSSNQIPTFDGDIVRWTTTIYGGTW